MELVSVHVPKTGGASLMAALRAKYGRRLLVRYPPPLAPPLRRWLTMGRNLGRLLGSWPPLAVHGHFPASEYAETPAAMIVFIRDPVERAVSDYHYVHREHAAKGVVANDGWARALSMQLEEYLEAPHGTLGRYLDVPLERFDFIGAMDCFDEDVSSLCAWLGIPPIVARRNASPAPVTITRDMRNRFARVNPQELEVYEAAKARRSTILAAAA